MSKQEILENAIQKAIDGGWALQHRGSFAWNVPELADFLLNKPFYTEEALLIFNHDFAKALWGESRTDTLSVEMQWWQYHLQQMVIDDDPIKYLGENL